MVAMAVVLAEALVKDVAMSAIDVAIAVWW